MKIVLQQRSKLVFAHGWGLNSAVWGPLIERLSDHIDCISIDLPGYGELSDQICPSQLKALAEALLDQAPEQAHWCGWSLGGMATIQAMAMQPERFISTCLLCTTPKFVKEADWIPGIDLATFEGFANQLKNDYASGIQTFLALQAGAGAQAKSLVKQALALLAKHPAPSVATLEAGLNILANTDLRKTLSSIDIPCQIISGRRDRVIHPDAGLELEKFLPQSNYELLNSGHAPQLSCPDELSTLLMKQVQQYENTRLDGEISP